jgi:hypothetical protein
MAEVEFKIVAKAPKNEEKEEELVQVEFNRYLLDTDRKLKYRSRKSEFKPPLHWGQRKLLLSEIEFLTLYGHLSNTVLYVGAADGKHIAYLAELFPEHKFLLYDPNKFDECLYKVSSIKIFKQFFTDDDVQQYANQNILFISDIRNMPDDYVKKFSLNEDDMNDDIESNVKEDMEMQRGWYEKMLPKAAMFKFRLPYTPGKTEYFAGDILYQAWAPPTSTETRMILDTEKLYSPETKQFKIKTYDNTDYESILYRFNKCTRIQIFPELFKNCYTKGIYKSYDLVSEYHIISNYLTKYKKCDISNLETNICKITDEISKNLGKDFTEKYEEKKKLHNSNLKKFNAKYHK